MTLHWYCVPLSWSRVAGPSPTIGTFACSAICRAGSCSYWANGPIVAKTLSSWMSLFRLARAVGTSDLSSYSISSSGRPLMPPFWLTVSIWSLTPLSTETPGAALTPVRLLMRPILIGSPVAGPAATVVSVLGAAVVSVLGAAVVSVLGAAVVSVLGAAVVVVSSAAAGRQSRERRPAEGQGDPPRCSDFFICPFLLAFLVVIRTMSLFPDLKACVTG